ncbi:hypothetical protein AUEXF2481DRAFT_39654 [Aureobasidium subglaciale EXF-2481]|uniref:Uncharacterized protein n=1 Tax=Aureobasidium subglaciale (strain EXF-2481) TaxID=1043005 RepID=A0A074ZAJ9_AURSE|nr:uncharacterized protein AUEXF2481DRAFT_39654 [Aureobasidium subglaciale EXF-2481]KEQ95801.1 hypothetical protein AUEXF2481DRAFT_39654 [Aureobasidium subglaciale EXF-2481]
MSAVVTIIIAVIVAVVAVAFVCDASLGTWLVTTHDSLHAPSCCLKAIAHMFPVSCYAVLIPSCY